MKKLFLTSGLVICLACPAFADTNITGVGNDAQNPNNECVEDKLGVDGSTGNDTANIEATWTPIQYAINFAAGTAGSHPAGYVSGSTAAVSPITFDSKNTALTSNGFSARGYSFDHWSSPVHLEDGVTTDAPYSYANGATLATYGYNDSATLTAIWTANNYTVSYVAGTHGTDSSYSDTATFDQNYTIKGMGSTADSKSGVTPDTGYHFVKWNPTSTDSQYSAPANGYTETYAFTPYTIAGNLTLTAQFAPNTYTVNYNKGDHAAANVNNFADTNGATYDASYNARTFGDATNEGGAGMTAADGYTFRGWSTVEHPTVTENAGVYTVSNGWTGETQWKRTSDLTVYAAYTANNYQITFTCGTKPASATSNIAQGGVAGSAIAVTYAASYSALPDNAGTCSLPGYHFNGWSCANGISSEGGTYNVAGNTQCDATWAPNTIGLTWDKQGGTVTTEGGQNCTYDGGITLPTNPQKTGYTFGGWSVVAPAAPAANSEPNG